MKILLVEDEMRLSEALSEILGNNFNEVEVAYDGVMGLKMALSKEYDILLIDINLPKISGVQMLKKLRKTGDSTHAIILTARSELSDRIEGLDAGADDYLTKPFNTDELLARIRAVSRRKGEISFESKEMKYGNITFSPLLNKISTQTSSMNLTEKESKLLEYFFKNNTMVLPETKLKEYMASHGLDASTNLNTYIQFLQRKLNYLDKDVDILSIRDTGYKLVSNEKDILWGEESV